MTWYPEIVEKARKARSCLTKFNYTRFVSYENKASLKMFCCFELVNLLLSFPPSCIDVELPQKVSRLGLISPTEIWKNINVVSNNGSQ